MYVIYLHPFGRIVLKHDTIFILGKNVYISGCDEENNHIDFVLDLMRYPDDFRGYCHIVSYTTQGVTTPCNLYRSIY